MTTYSELKVLDKGYVRLLNVAGPVRRPDEDFDGSIRDIAMAARVSFGRHEHKERTVEADVKLAKYLWRHEHMTPFEMVETWWQMKLPIFVARQFVRHRTSSINEISGRYVTLPEDWYLPETVGSKPISNKQGRGEDLPVYIAERFTDALDAHCCDGYRLYKRAMEDGVAPEQARMLLSLNHYTIWLWKIDLRNLSHFIKLRADDHAQYEAREYAKAMRSLISEALPDLKEVVESR